MKKLLTILFLIPFLHVHAQTVQATTNAIDINPRDAAVNTVLPVITWVSPRLEFTSSQEHKIVLKADVKSGTPLKSVKLNVTMGADKTPMGSKAVKIDDNTFTASLDRDITVPDGEYTVELVAENSDGGVVREARTITVGMDAISDAVAIDRKDYALCFGTDRYQQFNDLTNPVFDANTIADELKNNYGFKTEVMDNPTSDSILIKIKEYTQKTYKPQDQLFIFFASHGYYDDVYKEGYLVATNSLANDPARSSYISYNRLRVLINNIPCKHIFLVMDACFGGTFDQALASSRSIEDANVRKYLAKKLSKETRKYLTSGGKDYVPDGTPGHHSPFAKSLLEALATNGGSDRILVLDEIKLALDHLETTPRFGSFGDDENGSDFVFVAK